MKPANALLVLLISAVGLAKTLPAEEAKTTGGPLTAGENLPGGSATAPNLAAGRGLGTPSGNLPADRELDFRLGRAIFRKLWVAAPSSTQASDGLGPLYDARSCMTCHSGPLGRGNSDPRSLLVRLSNRNTGAGDEVYGNQLQQRAIAGFRPEGQLSVRYEHVLVRDDGSTGLQRPSYHVVALRYGPLPVTTVMSVRVASPVVGLGLIESIDDADILSRADPDDRNGDGISGKANIVADVTGAKRVGRFGWKAEHATVTAQAASALHDDIGISNPLKPGDYGDCTAYQKDCLSLASGAQPRLGATEAPDPVLPLVTFFARQVGVPGRDAANDATVLAGKAVFEHAGCPACHRPRYRTVAGAVDDNLSSQSIWPYSDFLLHDMGEELADRDVDGRPVNSEWKTPPLWGLGAYRRGEKVLALLHDGRARTISEAILWHGGEAGKARNIFAKMNEQDRRSLLQFLESL